MRRSDRGYKFGPDRGGGRICAWKRGFAWVRVLRVCVCVCAAIYVSLFLWWASRGILAPAFGFNLASMRFFFRSVRGKDSLRHGWCIVTKYSKLLNIQNY